MLKITSREISFTNNRDNLAKDGEWFYTAVDEEECDAGVNGQSSSTQEATPSLCKHTQENNAENGVPLLAWCATSLHFAYYHRAASLFPAVSSQIILNTQCGPHKQTQA